MAYWLMKSEPDVYGIDDLKSDKKTSWDGVRNYQARNFMRDEMKVGDKVFFYHSNAKPVGIVGIAKVVKAAYPDHTQFDKKSKYFDEKATEEKPRWMMVDIGFVEKFSEVLTLDELKTVKAIEKMPLLQRGQRLSVQPVGDKEWKLVAKMAGAKKA